MKILTLAAIAALASLAACSEEATLNEATVEVSDVLANADEGIEVPANEAEAVTK